jgi:hypothetical protein
MMDTSVPKDKVVKTSAFVVVKCDNETAFNYISSSVELPDWLKKAGPVDGVKKVEVIDGPYTASGAKRKVIFDNGDTIQEELLNYNPFRNYDYRVTAFSDFLRKLTDAAFGQFWFDEIDGNTRILWEYSYTYKNRFSRVVIWLFNVLFFKKFIQRALDNAKIQISTGSSFTKKPGT